jgi:hypothetical protein
MPHVQIEPTGDGRTAISVVGEWRCFGATIPTDLNELHAPGAYHSSVTPPRRKIAAAKWFLSQLTRCVENEAAALMFLEAFLSELRASTWALQKLLSRVAGFKEWYGEKQNTMRENTALRWLVSARNESQKEGLIFAGWGPGSILRYYRDGGVTVESKEPTFEVSGAKYTLSDLAQMVDPVAATVEEAHTLFYPNPPGRKHAFSLEFVREREYGTWEHFDPPNVPTIGITATKST